MLTSSIGLSAVRRLARHQVAHQDAVEAAQRHADQAAMISVSRIAFRPSVKITGNAASVNACGWRRTPHQRGVEQQRVEVEDDAGDQRSRRQQQPAPTARRYRKVLRERRPCR
jgi:hypothetical protein